MGTLPQDFTGRTFGRLTVIKNMPKSGFQPRVLCRCSCGTEKVFRLHNLRHGETKSCGCLQTELLRAPRKHGLTGSPVYHTWGNLLNRCGNPNNNAYAYYGGRGITVCDRWRDFSNFYADMGPKPSPAHSLGRIDNDGDYEPSNCRWATQSEQTRNRSDNHWLTVNGETLCLADWAKRLGVETSTIRGRLARGWDIEEALTTPPNERSTSRTHLITFRGETLRLSEWAERIELTPDAIRYRLKQGWSLERTLTTPRLRR